MTVVMIAHRLSTLKSCGRIVRLQQGRVAAIVGYQELVADGALTSSSVQPEVEAGGSQ
jgi:ABC-type bacteriocin/lantibiotic exporter with double-glycine peptidase domain